ncbi:hypothetical protein Tco_1162986 [Tanacetum coccineum]
MFEEGQRTYNKNYKSAERLMSLSGAWVTRRGLPYYPVDNRVVVVRMLTLCSGSPCSVPYSICLVSAERLAVGCSWAFRSAGPNGTSVVKDPLPVDEAVDLPYVELLNENRTIIWKYPEIFLCLVGLIRSFTEIDGRPTLLYSNDEEMGLLDFVNSVDPFKVKTSERTLAKNEVLLLNETEDKVISPSPQTISLVDHTIQDELNVNVGKRKKRVDFVFGSLPVKKARAESIIISDSRPRTAGKSPITLRRLINQSDQANTGFGSAAPAAEDTVSSSVTPTPERAPEDDFGDNVRTRPPSGRFVVLYSSSTDTDIPTSPQVVPLVFSTQAGVNVFVIDLASDTRNSSAPELEAGALSAMPRVKNVTNNARIDNLATCQSFLDHVTPPGYRAALRNQRDAEEKYEKKFTDSAAIVQQRDVEIVDLKAQLEKSEAEAAEVIELRKRVSDLEAVVAVKTGEVA